MALINATSFAGFLVLAYLFSFLVLAILRVATGVSIQRIGLTSLRHISYTVREGLRIDIRGLGLSIHRPTFSQPTWVSLRLQELCITIDPALSDRHVQEKNAQPDSQKNHATSNSKSRHESGETKDKSDLWQRLTRTKEHLKAIHDKIQWLRMFDVYATDTTLDVVGAGSLNIGSITLAVHTRRKLLDRGRLFRHKKDASHSQRPAEWIFTVRSILLCVSGREPTEILDNMSVNIHGLLYKEKSGLRDTSIAIKVGRLHIPVDDVLLFKSKSARNQTSFPTEQSAPDSEEISLDAVFEELGQPGSREAAIVQTVADSKDFLASVLRGVQEVQLGMSFIRISKEIESLRKANLPVMLNVVTHEIGIDLHRMVQNSPAHRMYFSPDDIAHQALVAAVSISLSLDEDDIQSDKIMYIPMATTTIRTTLPSKTMNFTEERNAVERNSNVFFANLVVTSPSVNLTPQHLIQLLAIAQKRTKKTSDSRQNHRIISRLLPRATIKFSIHEPVIRFILPVAAPTHETPDDFDMIISAISSVSFDIESSHSAKEDLLYSLSSNFRVVTHTLYYQAASGIKHNLMKLDLLETQVQVSASTEVLVVVSGALRSFSILMVREEVSQAVYNIVRHFRRNVHEESQSPPTKRKESFLRRMPAWLLEFHFEGTNCSFETAGVDKTVSIQTRGAAVEIESWTISYVAHRDDHERHKHSRRKISASIHSSDSSGNVTHISPTISPTRHYNTSQEPTDGRRLTTHIKGVQGFIIESLEEWEQKPFMSVPRIEVAFSTSRDHQGPICHLNSHVRAFYLDFSLYRAYSIGVAASVVQDAMQGPIPQRHHQEKSKPQPQRVSSEDHLQTPDQKAASVGELLAVDMKVGYTQLKMRMPHDPTMMLQIYEVSAGRHRWSAPFLRSHLVRLHASSPHVSAAWARIVSVSAIRVDFRQTRKKTVHGNIEEKSVDISTDFIRLGVPHGLRMFKVFDNFVNTFKCSLQLNHRFKTKSNDYILKKGPEKPKHVPRVSVRSKALMFELEDDPFEWRLSGIYHVGRNEQKQRIAREDAFNMKLKKMQEGRGRRAVSRRAHSTQPVSRDPSPMTSRRRSHSQDTTPRRRSTSRGRRSASKLRYDREGTCHLSSAANVQVHEARVKLDEYNARSWKSRIDWLREMQSSTIKDIRRMFSGADEPPTDIDDHETILSIPNRPGILTIVISDLHLVIDKPSFPLSQLPKFLHDVGKGMPESMQYALLIPMSLALDMGEARFMLRDYPLNLLHVPAIRPGQPPKLPSWSLRTDFVIAEEFRDERSIRHVQVEIVPKGQRTSEGLSIPGFSIDVRRTVAPVKTYSMPVIDINTSAPTSISWGTSYQPAIQDAMMIIESFTKPEIDPSDRVGFWDKIRLSFHSRPVINWKGDGDVQLRLKGSRDPYIVTGYGAGFVLCWRNNVRWAVHEDDDPKKFMTVRSGEFVLAIPDYSHKARGSHEDTANHDMDSINSSSSLRNAAVFSKVIMKVSGNVQWTAGLVFERDEAGGGRSFGFKPHYDVILRNPKYLSQHELKAYDAFNGFRSQHIHMSVTLAAPFDRDWTIPHLSPSESYNSVHLTPRFFSHFFAWWSTFSGIMSLPVRQGPLWRGPDKTSKKFGRHLATIKYGLLLSPLFIAHIYKHKDSEDYQEDVVAATGLKLRLDSFLLDLHQRREWFDTLSRSKSEQMRTSAMKINRAELDFVNADLRAVAANIQGTTAEDLKRATNDMLSSYQEMVANVDMSKFTIPDHDFAWIDMDDFVEMEWILPAESNPETKILPLAFTPRFTYFRQTDHGHGIHGDETRESTFGDEDSHLCLMPSRHNDPRRTQMRLIQERLQNLEEQIKTHDQFVGEHELTVIREPDPSKTLEEERAAYHAQTKALQDKKVFLEHGLHRLSQREYPGEVSHITGDHFPQTSVNGSASHVSGISNRSSMDTNVPSLPSHGDHSQVDIDGLYSAPHDEYASDFNNRFIIHNAQVKWNNSLRNIILRYSHQVSQRRGFVYYMSRRAVKFILDIVDEQSKRKDAQRGRQHRNENIPATPTVTSPTEERDEDSIIEERIQQLLNDGNRFVTAEDPEHSPQPRRRTSTVVIDPDEKLAEDFLAMNSYNIRLIAPQIQLQSEKNTTSVVLLTAKGMQLKVISIMDKERLSDDVSGLVQRRFSLDQDGVQIFVTTLKLMSKFIHLYSGNKYGNSPGSSWPPWASVETMFDFQIDPFGFHRVVQKTSASLRYEKYNALRLKYNEQVAEGSNGQSDTKAQKKESRIDHLWVDFPRLRASCDSRQYYTMYIIVLDLLMYHEPLEKTRSERLERIMLATDFSDLRGAPEMAVGLQERIRQLNELKVHFMLNARFLDRRGWQDRIDLEKDLASCEDELFFIMKAITTSQQRSDDRSSQSSGFLRWYLSASQVVWHLMKDKNEPLLEFQLGNAAYERIDNSDGSNHNAVEIESLRGLNLLPNALYPEIIGPFHDPQQKQIVESPKMLRAQWFMLEAIAGIPVFEEFEVTMYPLKVQLERSLGKALFEYIFPGIGSNAFDNGGFSPLMVKNMKPLDDFEDEENERARDIVSPHQPPQLPDKADMADTSPGAIGSRLQPTYNLGKNGPAKATSPNKSKGLGISKHRTGLFGHSHHKEQDKFAADVTPNILQRQSSAHSLSSFRGKTREGSTTSLGQGTGSRYNLSRNNSQERGGLRLRRRDSNNTEKDKKKSSDDVSQMVARASNYMTLAHVKLNSFVICLSYKGQRDRNLEDLHDLVFRMPPLEYRNKTWSNLDLALHFKKDVIRALISHTGAIISNKLSHHRPGKKQAERLREIAAGNALLPNSETLVNTPSVGSDQSSVLTDFDGTPPRTSFQSDNASRKLEPSPLLRSGDWAEMTDPRTRGDLSMGTIGYDNVSNTNSSNGNSLYIDSTNGQTNSSGQHDSFPFSPSSPGRIDPLGPISSVLPRPSTGGGGFIPGKSLLKDVVGRHFSTGGSPESSHHKDRDKESGIIRPMIHKGRVRFTTRTSFGSNGDKGERRPSFTQQLGGGGEATSGSSGSPEQHRKYRSESAPADQQQRHDNNNAETQPPSTVNTSGTETDGGKDYESEAATGGNLGSVKRKAALLLGKKVLAGFKS